MIMVIPALAAFLVIFLYLYPNEYNLKRLPALVAHEFHHNLRFSYFDWRS
ncbi:DUF2268 domain-containing putative Zn-dependent protease [Paenibacillus sp. MER TA 81-3]|nr:DUF2268 domain-containing putative Zn-dependent protease [Paenibacillus sp. MER TA 81-3]